MNPTLAIYLCTAATLIGLGIYGLLIVAHLLRKLLALNLVGAGIFLLMITLGGRGTTTPDAVSQALVLTGIVVAVAATGFALALLLALNRAGGGVTLDPQAPDAAEPPADGH